MRTLAKTLIDTLAYLELSPDDVVDPETAMKTMEMIAAALQDATPAEREALAEAAMAELNAQTAADAPEEVLDFYEHILADIGLEEPAPDAEDDED